MKTYKCTHIQWDTDEDQEIFDSLPQELTFQVEDEDELSDLISDETGFCHFGFNAHLVKN
jgi:hypothetical protein